MNTEPVSRPPKPSEGFAVPGGDSIIDLIHPATGRGYYSGDDLAAIQARYPGAAVVKVEDFIADKARRQDAEAREWQEVAEERYMEMLGVLPPAGMIRGAFLVGEPYDHHAGSGKPRFACFKCEGDKYFALSCHITHAEFCATFGKTPYTYTE